MLLFNKVVILKKAKTKSEYLNIKFALLVKNLL